MEIIQIITSIVTIISIFFLFVQVWLLRLQYKGDHERSRRQSVIELQKLWMDHHCLKTRLARQLVTYFDDDSCNEFWTNNVMKISIKARATVCYILDCNESDIETEGEYIHVKGSDFHKIRDCIIRYLNLLEVIFTSWRYNVGDREIIEEEFGKNISSNNSQFPLDKIVNASTFLPSIKAYTNYLKENQKYKSKKVIE